MTTTIALLKFAIFSLSLLKFALAGGPDGLNQEYCSPDNTGSDEQSSTFHWMSNGRCLDQCKQSYAFAVVQNWTCWCSNYIPANQQDVGSCSSICPGYGYDLCGNQAEGLYGYIPIPSMTPSGTAGAADSAPSTSIATSATPSFSATPTSTPQPSTTAPLSSSTDDASSTSTDAPTSHVSQTVYQTVTQEEPTPSVSVVVSYLSPTSWADPSTVSSDTTPSTFSSSVTAVAPATTSDPESSSPSLTPTPSPMTSVRVITISGAAVTQTVTSTPMVMPQTSSDLSKKRHLSGGAIAGIVIGSIVGIAALAFGAFLVLRRQPQSEGDGQKPKRTTSVLSRTGLISRARPQSMAEQNNFQEYVHTGTGQNSTRNSMFFGAGAAGEGDGVSPVSPLGSSHDTNEAFYGRSNNKNRVHDQRLNPSAIFANQDANGSRVSMQDQHDYSRPLGVTNPDLRPSTDTRGT